MRRYIFFGLLWLLPVIVGCGDKSLILTIDLLSFIDPALVTTPYGPIAPDTPTTTVDFINENVNLLEGIEDATRVASAKITVAAEIVNETGNASGRLVVHIDSAGTDDPLAGEPIIDIPVNLRPGQTTTVRDEVKTTPELIDVLTQSAARIAVRFTFNTIGSAAAVEGNATLTQLLAVVVTKQDL
jgi:hypothetical protein